MFSKIFLSPFVTKTGQAKAVFPAHALQWHSQTAMVDWTIIKVSAWANVLCNSYSQHAKRLSK